MDQFAGTCPLSQRQIVDQYFAEQRARVIDIAAFLDRLDRAADLNAGDDFRVVALRRALEALGAPDQRGRVARVQMVLSDLTVEVAPTRDQQSAYGAPRQPA